VIKALGVTIEIVAHSYDIHLLKDYPFRKHIEALKKQGVAFIALQQYP
jgi:hypothetical protein